MSCVKGGFQKDGYGYWPLWWYGEQSKLNDFAGDCTLTPSGAYFDGKGYYFDGANDHLIDADGRKILQDGTLGTWFSVLLTDGDVPAQGSIQGTGTKLYLNRSGIVPKVTGKIALRSEYCPNLTTLRGDNNSISVLDVNALTNLIYLNCSSNFISVLDVSALTSLTTLKCSSNSMNQAMVDTVLCDVDGLGTNNGTLDTSGNAIPSAAGIACKNNLIGRGWTVTTD